MVDLKLGDLVVAVPPFQLVCGSGPYSHAVVAQVEPLVLVSEAGDMLWHTTLTPGCVRAVGTAAAELRAIAQQRLDRERETGCLQAQGHPLVVQLRRLLYSAALFETRQTRGPVRKELASILAAAEAYVEHQATLLAELELERDDHVQLLEARARFLGHDQEYHQRRAAELTALLRQYRSRYRPPTPPAREPPDDPPGPGSRGEFGRPVGPDGHVADHCDT